MGGGDGRSGDISRTGIDHGLNRLSVAEKIHFVEFKKNFFFYLLMLQKKKKVTNFLKFEKGKKKFM